MLTNPNRRARQSPRRDLGAFQAISPLQGLKGKYLEGLADGSTIGQSLVDLLTDSQKYCSG